MIKNQWYVVLESCELKKNKILNVKRLNEALVFWRDSNGIANCISNRCCHRGASLGQGKITNNNIECPFHGFQFNGQGKVVLIPANGKIAKIPTSQQVKHYKTFEKHGLIWIWWGDESKCTEKPYFFEELDSMSYSTFVDHWNSHYSRCIENQLDVVHLAFVHKTTIGAGNKTLVNGPVVIRNKELITFYVDNRVDDGKSIALKPEEITNYENLFNLQFHYPNIWKNNISNNMKIFAAFVPVDEENTLIYLRNYQNFIKTPIVKNIVNYLMKLSNIIILRQDKRVVIKQNPKKTTASMDEKLIMGDKPIVEYRKHRQELIDLNNQA